MSLSQHLNPSLWALQKAQVWSPGAMPHGLLTVPDADSGGRRERQAGREPLPGRGRLGSTCCPECTCPRRSRSPTQNASHGAPAPAHTSNDGGVPTAPALWETKELCTVCSSLLPRAQSPEQQTSSECPTKRVLREKGQGLPAVRRALHPDWSMSL